MKLKTVYSSARKNVLQAVDAANVNLSIKLQLTEHLTSSQLENRLLQSSSPQVRTSHHLRLFDILRSQPKPPGRGPARLVTKA